MFCHVGGGFLCLAALGHSASQFWHGSMIPCRCPAALADRRPAPAHGRPVRLGAELGGAAHTGGLRRGRQVHRIAGRASIAAIGCRPPPPPATPPPLSAAGTAGAAGLPRARPWGWRRGLMWGTRWATTPAAASCGASCRPATLSSSGEARGVALCGGLPACLPAFLACPCEVLMPAGPRGSSAGPALRPLPPPQLQPADRQGHGGAGGDGGWVPAEQPAGETPAAAPSHRTASAANRRALGRAAACWTACKPGRGSSSSA